MPAEDEDAVVIPSDGGMEITFMAFVTGYVYMYKRALYRDARRTHTKWFCIARERVPMQRERVLLPTKRFSITVRLDAKGRAWRAGVEAVHGERVCRAVRETGLLFSYKYIQTTYYTPHYYTHQSTTPHRLHDSPYVWM